MFIEENEKSTTVEQNENTGSGYQFNVQYDVFNYPCPLNELYSDEVTLNYNLSIFKEFSTLRKNGK